MFAEIPTAQLVGTLIEYALWVGGGVYIAWIHPAIIRRKTQRGELTADAADQKLKRLPKQLGMVLFFWGIANIVLMLSR